MEDFASSHFVITSIKIQIDALKKPLGAFRLELGQNILDPVYMHPGVYRLFLLDPGLLVQSMCLVSGSD